MRRILLLSFLILAGLSACSSCGHEPARVHDPSQAQARRDSMQNRRIEGHREFLKEERASIEAFSLAKDWQLESTGTGLYIKVFRNNQANTPKAVIGDKVYALWYPMLLDGTKLYSDSSNQQISWRVEKEEAVAIGLHEVVKMMSPGDSARLVLPSHLAYGVAGINDKVPMRSALAGRILLIEVEQ
jgi:FKBP-type peptidyl-prolyl cis-trans isomerase